MKLNNLKRRPVGCTIRLTPKPPGRNYGKPRMGCSFVGGPWAGSSMLTRTGAILPIVMGGGSYVRDTVKDRMVWSAA